MAWYSRVALSRVLNGKAAMSANLAIRLEMSDVSTARAWLAMQTSYDLSKKILNNSLMIKIA
ncbi:Plasmid maintenance system antidote protein [Bartonella grahamii]|uniref:Plasmid maintenance system antidote protein n=1 Tax=Bartonella grahamii TaxID=33045 RepID=A0A336NL49_BARGR|nr:Plasmid maintenance system antidote protein [Bartonella grahamii]